MNPELREMLGIVAYQAAIKENGPAIGPWEDLSDHAKELYCTVGEAVAMQLAQVTIPALQSLAFAFTGKHVEMSFEKERNT